MEKVPPMNTVSPMDKIPSIDKIPPMDKVHVMVKEPSMDKVPPIVIVSLEPSIVITIRCTVYRMHTMLKYKVHIIQTCNFFIIWADFRSIEEIT